MTPQPTSRRPACPQCLRPQSACICRWVTSTSHVADVLILQHPMEVRNAKGSARLLHLSLPHSRLVVGESFAETELHALLHAPSALDREEDMHAILLYPETPDDKDERLEERPQFEESLLADPGRLRLVILDGTWRKSRKILHLNPQLRTLPRLPLRDMPPSQYLIRKARNPEQLSTLEAACYALMRMERNTERYLPLLEAFKGFVAQQAAYRPE
jgi:DTW domain-containing protein YfiP